jgi:hydroxymethylbilane synthase
MNRIIKIGTRDSELALAQTQLVINEIQKIYKEFEFKLVKIKTKGDINLHTKLDLIDGRGMFVEELERALLQGEIDIAVHSMKDVPVELPRGLIIGGVINRADPRDVLISLDKRTIENLPEGAIIGTSCLRRELLILEKRPDLKIKLLRGNVLTRLDKLFNKEYDAIILAAAGLERLGLMDICTKVFDVSDFIPASCQGILGIEIREGDELQRVIDSINDKEAYLQMKAERGYLKSLGGGYSMPFAAHAAIEENKLKIFGLYADSGNLRLVRDTIEGDVNDAYELGFRLGEGIKSRN